MGPVKVLVEITIDQCRWSDDQLKPAELEAYFSKSMRAESEGLSAAIWKMGVFHDFEVKKVARVITVEQEIS